jgi:hypothetical protein
LQKTINLVHCDLGLLSDDDYSEDQPPDIMFPHMESLVLRDPASDPVADYLHTFIVPALSILQIPESFLGPNPIDSLTSFISKSDCNLQEVRITGERSVPEASYHEAFPSILKFSFTISTKYKSLEYVDDSDSDSSNLELQ